jgi:hypothetical protein
MSATEKYRALIDMAYRHGVANFSASEEDGVLTLSGSTTEAVQQELLKAWQIIDPSLSAGDLVFAITADDQSREQTYTVKPGDTLSGIAAQYGTTWQKNLRAQPRHHQKPRSDLSRTGHPHSLGLGFCGFDMGKARSAMWWRAFHLECSHFTALSSAAVLLV